MTLRDVYKMKVYCSRKKGVKGVNNTSHDKFGACANETAKRCNRILSEITLGRNYATVGYSENALFVPRWAWKK